MDGLGQDQIAAVTGVLDARARVLILQGDAGTGKTTSLKAIVAANRLDSRALIRIGDALTIPTAGASTTTTKLEEGLPITDAPDQAERR